MANQQQPVPVIVPVAMAGFYLWATLFSVMFGASALAADAMLDLVS